MVTQGVKLLFPSSELAVSMVLIYTSELWPTVNRKSSSQLEVNSARKPKHPWWNLKLEDELGKPELFLKWWCCRMTACDDVVHKDGRVSNRMESGPANHCSFWFMEEFNRSSDLNLKRCKSDQKSHPCKCTMKHLILVRRYWMVPMALMTSVWASQWLKLSNVKLLSTICRQVNLCTVQLTTIIRYQKSDDPKSRS